MYWMSKILLPVSRNRITRIKDAGLAKLVQSGAGLWNPNEEKLILLPLGEKIFASAEKQIINALKDFCPQSVDTCGSSRGAMDIAVRLVKRANNLPLLLAERRHGQLALLGMHADDEASFEMANSVLRAIGTAMVTLGVPARRVERTTPQAHCIDLLCPSASSLNGEEGLHCGACGWASAYDSPFRLTEEPDEREPQELKEVLTPDCPTVEKLKAYLNVTTKDIVKIMFYTVKGRPGLTAAVLRGDRQVCLEKLRAYLGGARVYHAEHDDLHAIMGDSAGYLGPVGLPPAVTLIADPSVVGIVNAVAGANKPGYHITGVCWGRDFSTEHVVDISTVQESDTCPLCHGPLQTTGLRRLVRLYPTDLACAAEKSLTFFNGEKKVHIPAWSATVDLTSVLSAVMENADCWPATLAPFDDFIYWDGDAPAQLPALTDILERRGRTVLADDRPSKKLRDRVDEAAALFAPETLFIREEHGQLVIEATRGSTKETLTLEQFAQRP